MKQLFTDNKVVLRQLIQAAFNEDLGVPHLDITTKTLFPNAGLRAQAVIISKSQTPIVIAGLELISLMIDVADLSIAIEQHVNDSDIIEYQQNMITLSGNANHILVLERTVLNFLRHLSGVATLTRQFVERAKPYGTKILDTRKTTPGLRILEKYAVVCGGGVNHRMGLYDALMIKDTHVDVLGGMSKTIAALPDDITERYPVICEVRNEAELNVVLTEGRHKITRVLLDNMNLNELSRCVEFAREVQMPTEASGNINLNTIEEVAKTGVDFASVGSITHSAPQVDLSLQIRWS